MAPALFGLSLATMTFMLLNARKKFFWASMGEEAKIPERIAQLKAYKITRAMMAATGRDDTIFLHCLPAFHNHDTDLARQFPDICEVEDEVFEGPRSRVFDEAENRVHTIKAVMVATLGE